MEVNGLRGIFLNYFQERFNRVQPPLLWSGTSSPLDWSARAPIQRAGCARLGGQFIKGKRKIAVWLREITES